MNARLALSSLVIVSLLSIAACSSDESSSSSSSAPIDATTQTVAPPAETGVGTSEASSEPSAGGGGGGAEAGCAAVPAKSDIEEIVGISLDDGESLGTDTLDCRFRGTEESDSVVSFSQLSSPEALASFEAQGPDTGAALIDDPGLPGAKLQFGLLYFVQNDVLYALSVLVVGTDSETATEQAIELMKVWVAI